MFFFTIKFTNQQQWKLQFKLPPPLKYVATIPCEKVIVRLYCSSTFMLARLKICLMPDDI